MHTLVTASKLATVLGFFIAISSSLDITDPVVKSIDDLDVLDVRDIVPNIAETFHVVLETFIMPLPDGL
jgi:hypothetical protein